MGYGEQSLGSKRKAHLRSPLPWFVLFRSLIRFDLFCRACSWRFGIRYRHATVGFARHQRRWSCFRAVPDDPDLDDGDRCHQSPACD